MSSDQHIVLLSLGSNLGDKIQYLNDALDFLTDKGHVLSDRSSYYLTSPWGVKEQDWFINMAVKMNTDKNISVFHNDCQAAEKHVGRVHYKKWGPRKIDIDLLYFDDLIIQSETLVVPHPRIAERRFVLIPLAEIAGEYIDPVAGDSINTLLLHCKDQSEVIKYESTMK